MTTAPTTRVYGRSVWNVSAGIQQTAAEDHGRMKGRDEGRSHERRDTVITKTTRLLYSGMYHFTGLITRGVPTYYPRHVISIGTREGGEGDRSNHQYHSTS
mmetsp:Transcript_19959/g.22284  ORF Transcript_19959/g.22284 Transcript_19959/m.22284 type:complete len:101 (-) Transcript_19959:335-637(-)